jgi:hypothetical protein
MPIHDIFRARYCTLETRAELTSTKLDIVIAEVVIKHPEMDHIAAYANQWTKTRELASWQLLSILGVAITDEDLHLHFDYISMHIRCLKILSEMRQRFIAGADIQNQAMTTRNSELSLSRYLAEGAMAEDNFAARTVISIFIADPAAAAAAQKVTADAPLQSEMLRHANVSLKRASEVMSRVIETEGDVEAKKAGGLQAHFSF